MPTCLECGREYSAKSKPSLFCRTACRQSFNNRRQQRGAEFYDVVMEMRFDRKRASATGAWSMLCAIAARHRNEDAQHREGRKSWTSTTRLSKLASRLGR